MKRKVLILTDTYFQIIVAVQLKMTVYAGDEVDLAVTDHSPGCEEMTYRLKKEALFHTVYYVHDDNSAKERVTAKVRRYLRAVCAPRRSLHRYMDANDPYDVVVFSNPSLFSQLVCHYFRKSAACYRMEEGYATYTKPFLVKSPLRRQLIRLAFGDLEKRLCGVYLFHPELFMRKVSCPLLRLKPLCREDEALMAALRRIFDYEKNRESYDADYIFLEEGFRASGVEVGDEAVIVHAADAVGRENFLVKRHPRNRDDPLSDRGIRTNRVSSVPWELVMLNENFREKTLLTVSSCAALAPVLYGFGVRRVFLLYRCTDKLSPMVDETFLRYIGMLREHNTAICIPADLSQLRQELTQ